ncbi:MAG: hypothetical protein VXV95_02735 [Candidatus Thermoplasmatota archaeon]|nr:hypothetical protein [Candidatus Thermoplasmatota archaeon]
MTSVLYPLSEPTTGLYENVPDKTSLERFRFFHADEGKPLATPWQVALSRAQILRGYQLPDGIILDCACGSGIQIAAYSEILGRSIIGVELNEKRARASAVNFRTVFTERGGSDLQRLNDSMFIIGDGRDGGNILATLHNVGVKENKVAFLHLDPARPRNSRAHALSEMAPRLDEVFSGWKEHMVDTVNGPAILLDLSPRISTAQMLEVEALVENFWPGVKKTWTWTSRGRGRVDRLALWIGAIAEPNHPRRFVRIPPDPTKPPLIMLGRNPVGKEDNATKSIPISPQRGAFISIIDSALVETGLADDWLKSLPFDSGYVWADADGRRPIIYHQNNLEKSIHQLGNLIVISGRIVDFISEELTMDTVDNFVEIGLLHDLKKITIRARVDPELQPKLQGSLDRQLARRHGSKEGFIVKLQNGRKYILCTASV